MKKPIQLYSVFFIVVFVSCSASKNLQTAKNKKTSYNKNPHFLNEIVVNPGDVVSSKDKSYDYKNKVKKEKSQEDDNDSPPAKSGNVSSLLSKYATLLGVSADEVTGEPLLNLIDDWYGTPYLFGGTSKSGIDCSAFSRMVLNQAFNSSVPRTAQDQYNFSTHIKKDELKEGDLVFFHTERHGGITHVGVYMQNNKFVHASSDGVMISDLDDDYWRKTYRGAGRVEN